MSARRDAIFALGLWLTRGDRPTQALPPGPDHAFALELVGAALRHKASLEWAIGRCCRPPRGELLAALLIGAAQLLVLPGVPDKAVVYRLTLKNGERLAGRGVKVYCMKHSFVHSKLMLADYCAVVGSINMDMRSFYEQFESAVYTDDVAVLGQIEADFGSAFAECEPLAARRRSPLGRLFDMILRVFAPLM